MCTGHLCICALCDLYSFLLYIFNFSLLTELFLEKRLHNYTYIHAVGFVCSLDHLQSSGCCDNSSPNSKRFNCLNCLSIGCCSLYEDCVSCCLDPDKVSSMYDTHISYVLPFYHLCTYVPLHIND